MSGDSNKMRGSFAFFLLCKEINCSFYTERYCYKIIFKIKLSCPKYPYKLGLVHTLFNPYLQYKNMIISYSN